MRDPEIGNLVSFDHEIGLGFRSQFSRAYATIFAIPTSYYVGHTHLGLVWVQNGILTRDQKNDHFTPRPILTPNFGN